MTDDPTRDELESIPGPEHATETEQDSEGHNFGAMLAVSELARGRAHDRPARTVNDENLPPLTKPFPSMRKEKRG